MVGFRLDKASFSQPISKKLSINREMDEWSRFSSYVVSAKVMGIKEKRFGNLNLKDSENRC